MHHLTVLSVATSDKEPNKLHHDGGVGRIQRVLSNTTYSDKDGASILSVATLLAMVSEISLPVERQLSNVAVMERSERL